MLVKVERKGHKISWERGEDLLIYPLHWEGGFGVLTVRGRSFGRLVIRRDAPTRLLFVS